MPGFTQIFGGNNIYPVQPGYSQLTYASNIQLQWPIEQAPAGSLVATSIMDLNPQSPGLTVSLPDARQVSTGYVALFNNISGNGTSVLSSVGGTLLNLVSGTVWQLYLVDNTTQAGTWRVFQFGASVSVAVAAALAGAGLTAIGSTLNEQLLVQVKSVSGYAVVNSDRATLLQWTGGVGGFTMIAPGTAGQNWFVWVKNQGNGNLTTTPAAGTIDGNATDVLAPGQSAVYFTDGANFFTLKGGAATSGGAFNLLQITVPGSGTLVLSGVQLNQIGYRFVGALSGNLIVQVPNTAQEYWIDNETTGAFTLSVATAGQVSPPTVPQGNRYILYCDGTNVLNALTSTVAFPITIAQGGTNATTAGQALTNLGGTTVGVNVFTAASGAAACTAIGAVPTTTQVIAGTNLTGGGALSGNVTLNAQYQEFVAIKSAVTTRSNTNVTANDPDLAIALPGAGTYRFKLVISSYTGGSAGSNFQYGMNYSGTYTAGSSGWGALQENASGTGSTFGGVAVQSGPGGLGTQTPNGPVGGPFGFFNASQMIEGILVATGAGTLALDWAQVTSNGTSPVSVAPGSYMFVKKIA